MFDADRPKEIIQELGERATPVGRDHDLAKSIKRLRSLMAPLFRQRGTGTHKFDAGIGSPSATAVSLAALTTQS